MFCPKCRQPTTSETIRFCRNCGASLNEIAKLIANDDRKPTKNQNKISLLNQPIYRAGAKLIFLSVILLPVIFILSYISDSPLPFIAPALIFFAGLSQLIYARIFGDEVPLTAWNYKPKTNTAPPQFSLSQESDLPTPPSSVTDSTTKLLPIAEHHLDGTDYADNLKATEKIPR